MDSKRFTSDTLPPTPYTLRPAGHTDQSTIKAFIRQANLNPMGLKWERFTLAIDQTGEIIGCIQHKTHKDGSIELASLVVVRPWRKRGVARTLIDHVKAQTGAPLWLMCGSHLIRFYQQFDFSPIENRAHMPRYFRRVLLVFGLIQRLTRPKVTLAIMLWSTR